MKGQQSVQDTQTRQSSRKSKRNEIMAVFTFAASVLLAFVFWAPESMTGLLGRSFKWFGYGLLGTLAVVLPVLLFLFGLDRFLEKTLSLTQARRRCLYLIFLLAVVLVSIFTLDRDLIMSLTANQGKSSVFRAISVFWQAGLKPEMISSSLTWSGGLLGTLCGLALTIVAGKTGAVIVLIAMLLALFVLVFNISYSHYVNRTALAFQQTRERLGQARRERRESSGSVSFWPPDEQLSDESASFATDGSKSAYDLDIHSRIGSSTEDPREVNADWLKRELAIERGEDPDPDEENADGPSFGLPEGDWQQKRKTRKSVTYDYPRFGNRTAPLTEAEDVPEREVPPVRQDSFAVRSDPGEQQNVRSRARIADGVPFDRSSSGEIAESRQVESSPESNAVDEQLKARAAAIAESDLEHVEEQGRAHWEDRSDAAAEVAANKPKTRRSGQQMTLLQEYLIPPTNLLNPEPRGTNTQRNREEIQLLGAKLEQTLVDFGVDAKVINFTTGPTITRFELAPGPGVKVSRITGLADDIALSLAAIGVRIEAPIPGKSAIGIEIPNKETEPVLLRGLIESEAFQKTKSPLTAALGRDIQGTEILCDLSKMPHLLIAGATGSGKSVCINSILISLLYRTSPEELRLLMIDPKVVELSVYNGIPHLLQPVVTDPKKAYGVLNWAVNEMTKRYGKFAENSVRDFRAYNELIDAGHVDDEKLPLILVVIDELSDLMATTPTEVEDAIARLTAMARAAGIHLIIATQRPSVDVITGVIKANIPSRIAFAVASQVDSRTIIDMGGAEKLLGKGDMLYYPQSASKPLRGQGAFVTDAEVERVIQYLKNLYQANYDEDVAEAIDGSGSGTQGGDIAGSEEDELLEEALKLVIETGYASVSLLQRRLMVGYPRAARMIDRLHELGYVGPFEGSKPRKVLITLEQYLAEQNPELDE